MVTLYVQVSAVSVRDNEDPGGALKQQKSAGIERGSVQRIPVAGVGKSDQYRLKATEITGIVTKSSDVLQTYILAQELLPVLQTTSFSMLLHQYQSASSSVASVH